MHKHVQQLGEREIIPVDLIEFNSKGRLLILGNSEQIAAISPHLTDLDLKSSSVRPNKIEGWLGQFKVELDSVSFTVDLVLDLFSQSIMDVSVKPLGYFAPKEDAQALAEALQQLPELVGIFDKPRYFNYKASICAHSRRELEGCTQCIDACPADAIQSNLDAISVEPSLCQGCGSCTAVCPSGAITYALPTLDVSVNRLRAMLKLYFETETQAPQLIIHDKDKAEMLIDLMGEQLDNHTICFSIEEIAGLSMPFWLSALAYGVANITVWDAGSHDDHDWNELQQEQVKTKQLLTALSYEGDLVSFCKTNNIQQLKDHLAQVSTIKMSVIERASFAGFDDKRRMISIALDHLHQHSVKPIELVSLEKGAAFGEISIDTKACTLCHSCVSVCPVGAVLDGVDQPQLNFIEDRCVQCGLCETACPEDAINLIPQYLFNREQARQHRLLHEEPIFHCISCNKGFATKKMIDTMMVKLKGHAMFQGAALERLKMCEDCRVKAMFNDTKGPM